MDKLRSNSPAAEARPYAEAAAETSSEGVQGSRDSPSTERRNGVRYAVSAEAVVVDARSRTRLRGRAADISLSGCYLDAISPFPTDTAVGLRLTTEGHSFECEARVTYSLQGMGMGLMFTKISADQTTELRRWIAELSGETGATTPALITDVAELLVDPNQPAETEDPGGWQGALSELVTLLRRKGLLDDSETASLRHKLTR